jgi:diguanylate cyclase
MFWPFRRKLDDATTPEQLADELLRCRERGDVLLAATQGLLACTKEFSFGYTEVDSEAFAKRMETLKRDLAAMESLSVLRRRLGEEPEAILAYITRVKAMVGEREKELSSIIDMLRSGLTSMAGEAQTFTATMQESSLRMERITQLDDLRRIREQLKAEVETMNAAIRKRRASDLRQLEELTREVDAMRQNLVKVTDASRTDTLTGAYNRLAFDTQAQHLVDRFQISGGRFALLMCDLDDFKRLNDSFGHIIGDRVLKLFVQECRDFFREQDFIARYGGEEFALILPGSSLRNAAGRAQAFCKRLAAKRYAVRSEDESRTFTFAVTVSIGVSAIAAHDTIESLIIRADEALYLAKHLGKSRAMSEEDIRRAKRTA